MRLAQFLSVTVFAAPAALADPASLRPPGWDRATADGAFEYTSPTGRERLNVRVWPMASDPHKAAETTIGAAGGSARDCSRVAGGALAVCEKAFSRQGNRFKARAYAVEDRAGGVLTALHIGLADEPGLSGRMDETGARMAALIPDEASSASPAPVAKAPEPAAPPAASGDIERVLFALSYASGAGGGIYPSYSPVYLFKGGAACDCAEIAPGDVDLASLGPTRPDDIGRWRKAGDKYVVTYGDGDTDELDPKVGPPAPLPGGRLAGRFSAIGGGGNTALGGDVMAIATEDFDFRADGAFRQGRFGGGGNSAVTAGASRDSAGRWRVDGATLTLTYPGGETVRTSIYWSANGDTVNGVPDVVWIGGDDYILEA